jgi:hypothetical protein
MPNAEKAGQFVVMGDKCLDQLDLTIRNAENTQLAMAASVDVLDRLLERQHSYRARIDAAHNPESPDDERLTDEEYDAAMEVFGALVGMTDALRRQITKGRDEQGPFLRGLRKAHAVVRNVRDLEERKISRAERDEIEEDAYRAERDAQTPQPTEPGNGNKPEYGPSDTTPQPDQRPTPIAEATPKCGHCGETIDPPTGTATCHRCTSHRNRYGKLPSENALNKRRERDNADT